MKRVGLERATKRKVQKNFKLEIIIILRHHAQ